MPRRRRTKAEMEWVEWAIIHRDGWQALANPPVPITAAEESSLRRKVIAWLEMFGSPGPGKGTRGPKKRDPRIDPDCKLFPEIRRLMEANPLLSVHGAVASLEVEGKIPGKASAESRIKRVAEKFRQQS